MYGAPFYGGIVPYAYPAPAAAGVPGSEGTAKADKPVASQTMAAANGSNALVSATLPPRVSCSYKDYPERPRHELVWHVCKVDPLQQSGFFASGSSSPSSSENESSQQSKQ